MIRVVMVVVRMRRLDVVLRVVHDVVLVLQTAVVLFRTRSVHALLARALDRPHVFLLVVLKPFLST